MPKGGRPFFPSLGSLPSSSVKQETMPKDLPGFFYDAEKNRYFPIKSRIPGSSSAPKPAKVVQSCSQSRVRTSKLLQIRELHGNVISSSKGKCNFKEEFRKAQASRPKIWRYYETEMLGDTALERVLVNLQLDEGETKTEVLLTGGKLGYFSISEVGKNERHMNYRSRCIPARVWPPIIKETECSTCPGYIGRDTIASMTMPSSISCIKRLRMSSDSTTGVGDSIQHALISTLGSENCGGSVYVLDLKEPIIDFHPNSAFRTQRIKRVASLDCTIWTGDCEPNKNRAAIGTNLGAALVDLESGTKSWVLRCRSDVLAQQFVHSGNAIICGLRNGAVVTVDTREKQEGSSSSLSRPTRLVRHKISHSPMDKAVDKSSKPWFKLSGNIQSSRTITLPSSICCLVALQFDDQYFLASSMDGSVKLYDHRLTQRGHVQSYDGHVNSHTRIQLGVDPSERLVMSGGEDLYLRLWSIKSGELIFQEKISNSVLSTVCWQGERESEQFTGVSSENEIQSVKGYSVKDSCGAGAWLGSDGGLFYMKCS